MKKKHLLLKRILLLSLSIISQFVNAQWQNKASGFATPQRGIQEMIAVNSNVVWAMGYDATDPTGAPLTEFTRSTDGGKHWNAGSIAAFPGFILVGIAPVSGTTCYGSIFTLDNGNAKIVKTTDGGATWTQQLNYDFGETFGFFANIYFFNENEGLAYGDQSNGYFTIFTTSDGGNSWTRVPEANMPAALSTDEASYIFSSEGIGNTFWTVSTSGRVWKTTDKGLHWNAYQTPETFIDYSNLKMRDALHGLWGEQDKLYRTNDGGITWNEITPTGNWFTNDLAYVPGTAATYVSTGGNDFDGYGALHGTGSSYSVDDGNTWITIDTAVEHLSLAMVNAYTGFTGGLNKDASTNGIFKYNGSALGYSCGNNLTSMCHKGNTICVANASIENHLSMGDFLGACLPKPAINNKLTSEKLITDIKLNVYPNPVSNSATISFSILQTQKVSIKIFDIAGRLVKILANTEMPAGSHQLKWNAIDEKGNGVSAGIYLLKFAAGNKSELRKLSILN